MTWSFDDLEIRSRSLNAELDLHISVTTHEVKKMKALHVSEVHYEVIVLTSHSGFRDLVTFKLVSYTLGKKMKVSSQDVWSYHIYKHMHHLPDSQPTRLWWSLYSTVLMADG